MFEKLNPIIAGKSESNRTIWTKLGMNSLNDNSFCTTTHYQCNRCQQDYDISEYDDDDKDDKPTRLNTMFCGQCCNDLRKKERERHLKEFDEKYSIGE